MESINESNKFSVNINFKFCSEIDTLKLDNEKLKKRIIELEKDKEILIKYNKILHNLLSNIE